MTGLEAAPVKCAPAYRWGPSLSEGQATFRLWAPACSTPALNHEGRIVPMEPDGAGWFSLTVAARPGDRYSFVLENGLAVPDPASRAQAAGVAGASVLCDPGSHRWTADWHGRPWSEAVISELHIGTFTPEGTFRAASERLRALAEVGITAIEIMPVAQFGGARGWGYDGALLFAPHSAYGTPDDLKALVDVAHGHGLMVLLDVVYNHFGPEGNFLSTYAPEFFHPERHTPWGAAIAYERPEVRAFYLENVRYWLEEFRLDGLRLDAVDHIRDEGSAVEILVEIAQDVRAAWPRSHIHLATEDNRNITRLHARGHDGAVPLYTAEWNDDFHNAAHVLATGETEGYYMDFAEDHWAKFARALAEGFAYQGEPSAFGGGEPRGETSGHLPPLAFIDFLQNHDQVGNRAFGERLTTLAPPPLLRAMTAILLLSPHVPLIFMGDEWGETRPFAFFTDFEGELADRVREGRRREFRHFAAFQHAAERATIPDPNALGTFAASKLDWEKRGSAEGRAQLAFTSELLATRQREIVPHLARAPGHGGRVLAASEGVVAVDWRLDGAVLRLRANLRDDPAPVPPAPGRVIFETPGGPASPYSVQFTVEPA